MIYYIWDRERNQWWKPLGRGYTSDIMEAGEYEGDAALAIINCATPPGQTVLVPEPYKGMTVWGSPVTPNVDTEESLTEMYDEWLKSQFLADDAGSAEELLAEEWLTDAQRAWLTAFIKRWEAAIELGRF